MKDINLILSNKQYELLNQEYNKLIQPNEFEHISTLKQIIKTLQYNSFKIPRNLQQNILIELSNAYQIINLIYRKRPRTTIQVNNNPFDLIFHLSQVLLKLNLHSFKSPYLILNLKASCIITNVIIKLSRHFK